MINKHYDNLETCNDVARIYSENHQGVFVYVWFMIDYFKYYYDDIPVPLYRERVVTVFLNGYLVKSMTPKMKTVHNVDSIEILKNDSHDKTQNNNQEEPASEG